MRFLDGSVLVVLGIMLGVVLAFGALLELSPVSQPPVVKMYNVLLTNSGDKVGVAGTKITSSGFCTSVWVGAEIDTVICTPHIITEATPSDGTVPTKPSKTPARF